jgi:hypothetical protein
MKREAGIAQIGGLFYLKRFDKAEGNFPQMVFGQGMR